MPQNVPRSTGDSIPIFFFLTFLHIPFDRGQWNPDDNTDLLRPEIWLGTCAIRIIPIRKNAQDHTNKTDAPSSLLTVSKNTPQSVAMYILTSYIGNCVAAAKTFENVQQSLTHLHTQTHTNTRKVEDDDDKQNEQDRENKKSIGAEMYIVPKLMPFLRRTAASTYLYYSVYVCVVILRVSVCTPLEIVCIRVYLRVSAWSQCVQSYHKKRTQSSL